MPSSQPVIFPFSYKKLPANGISPISMNFLTICLGFFLFFLDCSVILFLNYTTSKPPSPNCPSEVPEYSCPKQISSIFTVLNITLAREGKHLLQNCFFTMSLVPVGRIAYKVTSSMYFLTFHGCTNLVLKTIWQKQTAKCSQQQVNFTGDDHKVAITIINMMALSLQQGQEQKFQINGYQ